MPSHVIHFLHDSVVAPSPAPVLGTAFDAADVHVHDLQAGMIAPVRANRNFKGIVEGIHVRLTDIAGASKITIRLCADAAGDFILSVRGDNSSFLKDGQNLEVGFFTEPITITVGAARPIRKPGR